MTVLVEIARTCRDMGPKGYWMHYDGETRRFDSAADALEWVNETYPNKRSRKAIYNDTAHGTIQTGWIYSARNDAEKQFLQDWVTLAEVTSETEKTCRSLNVKSLGVR